MESNALAGNLFKSAQGYDSGAYKASSIALADVNGDGKPDLLVANDGGFYYQPGGVAVLLGNGDGMFQLAQICSSQWTSLIAAGDLNGDGKPDLVVENGSRVGVLLGNGDGTFQPAQYYDSGGLGQLNSIAVLDLNGDGKLDVVIGNRCDASGTCGHGVAGVLLGNGDGTFQDARTYDSGDGLGQGPVVAVADVSGDSRLDLLTVNAGGLLTVRLGNGNGTFQDAQTSASGVSPVAIAVGDLNGDGKTDLLLASPGEVGVLLGNGDGTFQPIQTDVSGSGFGPNSIAAADVNRDGKLDVLVGYYCVHGTPSSCAKGGVDVRLGNGDGTFQAPELYVTGGDFVSSILVADVNGDTKPDLIAANWCLKLNSYGNCGTPGWISVALNKTVFSTTTSLVSRPNPSVFKQAVTLTAAVTSVGSIAPTGKVVFKNGTLSIGTAILNGGVAVLTTKQLPVGTLSLSANYKGDLQSATSKSATIIQAVNQTTTTTTIKSSLNPSTQGQAVTFTAKVTSPTATATGSVTFTAGTTNLGTITLIGSKASVTTNALPAGSTKITAAYNGTVNIIGSSVSLMQVVN